MRFDEDDLSHSHSLNDLNGGHYKRLQELRDQPDLCEKRFSLINKVQSSEYEEVKAQLLFFDCPYEELRLEGMAFLFIPAAEADFISTTSERSSIRRILERIHGKR